MMTDIKLADTCSNAKAQTVRTAVSEQQVWIARQQLDSTRPAQSKEIL
jgi:secreted trypsin-like serine protease